MPRRWKINGIDAIDIGTFALAVVLAAGIWLLHGLSQNYTKLVNVPVQVESNLTGHASISSNTSVVSARCRTTGMNLLRLGKASRRKPLVIDILPEDLRHIGGEDYYLASNSLGRYVADIFGESAQVESFVSDTLLFRFPYQNNKKVPVQPVYTISFKQQYAAVSPLKVTPDSVTVYGEPFHLEQIDRVYTKSFALENLRSGTHGEIKLSPINGVRFSEESVEYSVDVSRYVEVTSEMDVESRHVPADKSLIIYPPVAKVTFKCLFPVTTNPVGDVKIYIDYKDFAGSLDGKCLPRTTKLPASVFGCDIEPQVFECVESSR